MFNKKTNSKNVFELITEISKNNPLLFNNFYGINDGSDYEVEVLKNTLLIRKKEFDFYRLYMVSSDKVELSSTLSGLKNEKFAVNIPSKKSIEEWDDLLLGCGFEFLDVYSRYYNNNLRSFPTCINTFASVDEVESVAKLLYENFSLYTDHLPSKKDLYRMAENQQIIADYKEGILCGVLIYTIIGNKGYQNAWIDKGDNGIALLFKVKSIFIERGIKYCYYWIKDTNKDVIKMHTMMGGKPDGLKDYNYLKQ